MKTESMIERVARAMCISDEMDPDSPGIGGIENAPAYWVHYAGMARAAIEAMREPTDGMVEAGNRMGCIPTYSRMIDAALSEEGE